MKWLLGNRAGMVTVSFCYQKFWKCSETENVEGKALVLNIYFSNPRNLFAFLLLIHTSYNTLFWKKNSPMKTFGLLRIELHLNYILISSFCENFHSLLKNKWMLQDWFKNNVSAARFCEMILLALLPIHWNLYRFHFYLTFKIT